MSNRFTAIGTRGDTIVEVLIAMAIIAVVLGGAYVSANRSFNSTQASRERDIAIRVGETQIERIRGYKTQFPAASIPTNSCMNATPAVVTNPSTPPALTSDNLSGSSSVYNANCKLNANQQPYTAGSSEVYYHIHNEVSANDYTVHVRWARSGGGENQEIILRYRFY